MDHESENRHFLRIRGFSLRGISPHPTPLKSARWNQVHLLVFWERLKTLQVCVQYRAVRACVASFVLLTSRHLYTLDSIELISGGGCADQYAFMGL